MHKTGACLPKLGQVDPRWQALVLAPRLPPERLLAPGRGCTLCQRDYNLSNAMNKVHIVGAKSKTPPFARCLRRNRWTNGDKTTGKDTLRPIRHRMKTCDEVVSSCDLVQHGGPRVIQHIVTGPAWPLRITGLICKGIPVITVCKRALCEYSGDNPGV
jgi:hypothetical protein